LAEELEGLQRSVMKQREIAAKERDAGREQQVREIVTACEKVCAPIHFGLGFKV